jgi:glutathione S-transferase
LNYKGLAFTTIYIEYQDVEATCKEAGIPPSGTKRDGTPKYTLPSIIDPATGIAVSDSQRIAKYLDETYPDKPMIYPNGSRALHAAFIAALSNKFLPFIKFGMDIIASKIITEKSEAYFRRERGADWGPGVTLKDLCPKTKEEQEAEWKNLERGLDDIGNWIGKENKFVMGDSPTFSDFGLAVLLRAAREVYGENSREWKDISAHWGEGRWGKFLENLEPYYGTF